MGEVLGLQPGGKQIICAVARVTKELMRIIPPEAVTKALDVVIDWACEEE